MSVTSKLPYSDDIYCPGFIVEGFVRVPASDTPPVDKLTKSDYTYPNINAQIIKIIVILLYFFIFFCFNIINDIKN